ncbi:hypothetical protein SAMN05216556_1308 [Aequorivita viscosa]|uniref:Uncharacterized protein n=1 Tax=Aequorivita viscosa TaxID=797419 RepID=A0A1M6MN30_9FLAO|nr:hypothetical protein SAMN05216556_1308 [Aequorivita viscosa]SHJ84867.1 hypothetical protein SAMN04487908_12828 [Aequorivita viscosa]
MVIHPCGTFLFCLSPYILNSGTTKKQRATNPSSQKHSVTVSERSRGKTKSPPEKGSVDRVYIYIMVCYRRSRPIPRTAQAGTITPLCKIARAAHFRSTLKPPILFKNSPKPETTVSQSRSHSSAIKNPKKIFRNT